MGKYQYIRIIHEGEDYITVLEGRVQYDIVDDNAIRIVKKLLKKINALSYKLDNI